VFSRARLMTTLYDNPPPPPPPLALHPLGNNFYSREPRCNWCSMINDEMCNYGPEFCQSKSVAQRKHKDLHTHKPRVEEKGGGNLFCM